MHGVHTEKHKPAHILLSLFIEGKPNDVLLSKYGVVSISVNAY